MSMAQLVAVKRDGKPQKIRNAGYLPGVIYGKEVKDNLIVKFKYSDVSAIIHNHGESAKLETIVNGKKHLAFIKDVQKDHISNKITHVDLQFVSGSDVVKSKVPVIFEGISELENNKLILEISRQEVELTGKIESIPESIKLDVSGLKAGTLVTCGDLKLDGSIRIHNANEILASIHKMKEIVEEEAVKEETEEAKETK